MESKKGKRKENDMHVMHGEDVFTELVKATQKHGIYLYFLTGEIDKEKGKAEVNDEIFRAAAFLDASNNSHQKIVSARCGCMLFDSEEDLDRVLLQCRGIDPDTGEKYYTGPIVIIGGVYTPRGLERMI